MAPQITAEPPASAMRGCAVRSRRMRSPGRQWAAKEIWLHIVPEGRKTAASLPSSSQVIRWSSVVVGSSPFCSSPTSAAHMNWRISREGRLAVSL